MVAGEIDFAASSYTLSSGSLTVNGGIALNSGVTASITSAIAGMHGPEIYGGGTLTLGGSDSGNTIVFGGRVVVDNQTLWERAWP